MYYGFVVQKGAIGQAHPHEIRICPSGARVTSEPEYLPPHPASEIQPDQTSANSSSDVLTLTAPQYRDLATLQPGEPLYQNFQDAGEFVLASKAASTRRAYDSDWRHFRAWCERHNLSSLPALPGTVVLYVTDLARPTDGTDSRKPATISRKLTSINTMHKDAKLDSPAVMSHRVLAATVAGIRRTLGTTQTMKKPLTRNRVVKVMGSLEGPIAAARDKALLLIGFAGALRRSELAAIMRDHVIGHRKGITIKVPRSKMDQEAKGREVEILWGTNDATCPVLALENWLAVSGIKEGFVFRSVGQYGKIGGGLNPNSIGWIIKKLVRKANLAHPEEYGGHSLRAGFVTEASANGAADGQIMKQTGHKTATMVRRYARGDRDDKQAAEGKLGL
jgi:integrase